MLAKREMAAWRQRAGRGPKSCDPPPRSRPDTKSFCAARVTPIGRRPGPVSPHSSSRGHNGKWILDAALAAQNRGARNHRAGGALCARRLRRRPLACGFWDHWVPGANDTLTKLCKEWGDKEKVDVAIDYITSQGDKNLLTIAAEAQSHSGHDILAFPTWYAAGNAENLEPVEDIVMTDPEIRQSHAAVEYLGKQKGHWVAVPAAVGTSRSHPARGSTCSSSMSDSI